MLAAVTPVHVHFRPLRYVPVLIDLQVGQTRLCDGYRGISTDLGQTLPNLQIPLPPAPAINR